MHIPNSKIVTFIADFSFQFWFVQQQTEKKATKALKPGKPREKSYFCSQLQLTLSSAQAAFTKHQKKKKKAKGTVPKPMRMDLHGVVFYFRKWVLFNVINIEVQFEVSFVWLFDFATPFKRHTSR